MTGSILVYGATGYTGKLVAQVSRARGSSFILAGRSAEKVKAVAKPLGLPWRAFDLGDRGELDAGVKDVAAVLCAAGPFRRPPDRLLTPALGMASTISTSPEKSTCSRRSPRETPRRSGQA